MSQDMDIYLQEHFTFHTDERLHGVALRSYKIVINLWEINVVNAHQTKQFYRATVIWGGLKCYFNYF